VRVILYHGGPLALLYTISYLISKDTDNKKKGKYVLIDGDCLLKEYVVHEQIYKKEYGIIKIPSIDYKRCDACGLCISACPINAIVGLPNAKPTILIDRCILCHRCSKVCDKGAIVIKEKKAYTMIQVLMREKEFILIMPMYYDNDPIVKSIILKQAIEEVLKKYKVDILIAPIIELSLIEYIKGLAGDVQYVVLSPLSSIAIRNAIYISKSIDRYRELLKALSDAKKLLKELSL